MPGHFADRHGAIVIIALRYADVRERVRHQLARELVAE
jgi:hypothetical protein